MRSIRHSFLLLLTLTAVSPIHTAQSASPSDTKQYVILGFDIQGSKEATVGGQEIHRSFIEAFVADADFNIDEVFKFVLKEAIKQNKQMENKTGNWIQLRLYCLTKEGTYIYVKKKKEDKNKNKDKNIIHKYIKEDGNSNDESDKTFSKKEINDKEYSILFTFEEINAFLQNQQEESEIRSNRGRAKYCAIKDMLTKAAFISKNDNSSGNNQDKFALQTLEKAKFTVPKEVPQLQTPAPENASFIPKEYHPMIGFIIGCTVGYILNYILKPDKSDDKKIRKKSAPHKKVKIKSKSPILISGGEVEVDD